MSLCIWREARGEPLEGKIAVGWVIRNRVNDSRWPSSYRDVVLQPKQFSCFNQDDPQSVRYPEFSDVWADCVHAWSLVMGALHDPTQGANHYHTPAVSPKWADPAKITARIGNHIFYRL